MIRTEHSETWFVAQAKPNSASIAEKNLKRQGFRTLMPLQEETTRRNGKFVTAVRPLFPGYVFVAFDVTRDFWRSINSTYGVSRLVSFGQDPAPVPRALIAQLLGRCDRSGKLLPAKELLPGDKVRVTNGPLANFIAEVEKIEPDRRIFVLMDIMGARTRVTVKPDQICAV